MFNISRHIHVNNVVINTGISHLLTLQFPTVTPALIRITFNMSTFDL